jgi:hypothetical protein
LNRPVFPTQQLEYRGERGIVEDGGRGGNGGFHEQLKAFENVLVEGVPLAGDQDPDIGMRREEAGNFISGQRGSINEDHIPTSE